jgi:hypothetical protein
MYVRILNIIYLWLKLYRHLLFVVGCSAVWRYCRFVVFENGLVVDTCCFLVGAKGTKRIFLAVNIDMCSVSSSIMCKHVVLVLHVAFKIIIENYYFFIFNYYKYIYFYFNKLGFIF